MSADQPRRPGSGPPSSPPSTSRHAERPQRPPSDAGGAAALGDQQIGVDAGRPVDGGSAALTV